MADRKALAELYAELLALRAQMARNADFPAAIAALQVWSSALRNPAPAVRRHREALALGGSQPLPEIYRAAGAKFAFDEETLGPLARRAISEATADPVAA
jgi:hypothetical protein